MQPHSTSLDRQYTTASMQAIADLHTDRLDTEHGSAALAGMRTPHAAPADHGDLRVRPAVPTALPDTAGKGRQKDADDAGRPRPVVLYDE
jgi:hypothetical protein